MKTIIFLCFLLAATAVGAQTVEPEAEAQRLFEKYRPTIEKKNGAVVQPPTAVTGDINGDGLKDCLLHFVLTPKEGGNLIVDSQTAVYLNTGTGMKVAGAFPRVNFCYVPQRIEKGIIYADEYVCAPPYNEKKGVRKFRYVNNKISLVK